MRNRKIRGMRERLIELLFEAEAIEKGNRGEVISKEIRQELAELMVERRKQA